MPGGLAGCTTSGTPRLHRWHWQWCLSSAASSLIGHLTLFPLRRSLCLLYLQAMATRKSTKACSSTPTRNPKRPPPHAALCPCPNVRAIRRAHLIDVPCRASHPPPPTTWRSRIGWLRLFDLFATADSSNRLVVSAQFGWGGGRGRPSYSHR